MPPSRTQKRWSGRLRTGGALLALLGTVGLADTLVVRSELWPLTVAMLAVGLGLYALGRKWSRL